LTTCTARPDIARPAHVTNSQARWVLEYEMTATRPTRAPTQKPDPHVKGMTNHSVNLQLCCPMQLSKSLYIQPTPPEPQRPRRGDRHA